MLKRLSLLALAASFHSAANPALVGVDWIEDPVANPLCGGYYLSPQLPDARGEEIEARALETEYDGSDRIALKGDAQLWNNQIALEADEISLYRVSGDGDAIGNVAFRDPQFLVRGKTASLNLYSGRVELRDSEIVAHELHLYGQAEDVVRNGAGIIRVRNVDYSFCAPTDDAWQMGAGDIKLDFNSGRGYAKNVTLKIKKVPFVWLPIIGFPVDERRLTGFLWPKFSLESSDLYGSDYSLEAPFYWNIAPQTDALIVPTRIAHRGNMLQLQQRYLFANESQSTVNLGWLDDDAISGGKRRAITATWATETSSPWIASAYGAWADDADYETDIGGLAIPDDEQFPGLKVSTSYRQPSWSITSSLKSYTLADASTGQAARPYRELPRIVAQGRIDDSQRDQNWYAQFVNFERDNTLLSGTSADTGSRVNLRYTLAQPFRSSWGYLTPAIGADGIAYALSRDSGLDDAPSAAVPRASVDAGLFVERRFERLTHRIEPRLKYLRVAHVDQDVQPNFDTGSVGFSFTQLFSDRRFSGGDRIGDTEQVTAGLSNRWSDNASGDERYRFDLGQTFYLRDRTVGLSANSVDTTARSPLVGEARVNLNERWSLGSEATLDPRFGVDSGASSVKYRRDQHHLATFRVRWSDQAATSHEGSVLWGLNDRWRVAAGYGYNEETRHSERFAFGFEYESCCWRTAIVQSYDRPSSTGAGTHKLSLQFQLKGLGQIGRRAINNLRDNIEDYEPRPIRY